MVEEEVVPNSREQIVRRRAAGKVMWAFPVTMLLLRSTFPVAAQAVVACIFILRSSPSPWQDAVPWWPVYGTLSDVSCLAALWWLAKREGIGFLDLLSLDRRKWRSDIVICAVIILVGLPLVLAGIAGSSLIVFGTPQPPGEIYESLPLLPPLYATLVWPVIVGLAEQMTFNGYLAPRFQVLTGSTVAGVIILVLGWCLEHPVLPLTLDPKFMLFRYLSPVLFATFITILYLRVRRLLPFIVAHAIMDGLGTFSVSFCLSWRKVDI